MTRSTDRARSGDDPSTVAGRTSVSLVICSRNRPTLLAETVASILAGSARPDEIVIIDQSQDRSQDLSGLSVADCTIRHTHTSSVGLSRARNEGVAVARHNLLVFTDDDVQVDPAWFMVLVNAALDEGERVVVTGQVLPSHADRTGGFVPSIKVDPNPAVFSGRPGEDVIYPHNLALYRSAIDAAGPFDTRLGAGGRFPAAEDNDFCHRLLESGFAIRYLPEAIVHHRAWRTDRDYLPLRWAYGRGQGAYYAKYLNLRDRYMLHRLSKESLERAKRVARRWRTPVGALGEAVYLTGLLTAAAEWLLTRQHTDSPEE